MSPQRIAAIIDQSPMNAGAVGSDWLANPLNIAVAIGENVMLFELKAEGLCEFHWLDTGARGRQAIADSHAAIRQVFADTNTRTMYGLVPSSHRPSRLMARWIGAAFVREIETDHGPCHLFVMTRKMMERN